jgi:4-hydroxybutyryl-CoA dehydratase/vinylacetyl-CoA-Delta-isomerase
MMTGAEYLASLNDGRHIYFEGRRIGDFLAEPGFAAPARAIADGYDRYYSPEPSATNPMAMAPRSVAELRERARMTTSTDVALNLTYQSLMTLITAAPKLTSVDPTYTDRIKAFFEDALDRDVRIAECITDAKGNRTLAPSKQTDPDAYVHVVKRNSDGVVIRGAKLHITAASMCHELMVMPTKAMKPGEEEYAIACSVPVNAPGVHIVNTTYHPKGDDTRHFPVSSRVSVPDGFVVFDDVFVPYERVFLDGETANAAVFAHSLGMWERLGGIAVLLEQADELVGLAQLIAEANGLERTSHIRDKIDEMVIHATMLRAGLEAALSHADCTPEGYYFPDELFTNAAKYQGAANFNLMVRHLHDIAGGAVLTAPSLADLENEATAGFVRKYMTTMPGVPGEYRMKLFHAIRDTTADSYGGWHLVTNIQSGGGLTAQRVVVRKFYDMAHAKSLGLRAAGVESLDTQAKSA